MAQGTDSLSPIEALKGIFASEVYVKVIGLAVPLNCAHFVVKEDNTSSASDSIPCVVEAAVGVIVLGSSCTESLPPPCPPGLGGSRCDVYVLLVSLWHMFDSDMRQLLVGLCV